MSGWYFFLTGLVATMVGAIPFAVATYRTGALPRSGAMLLGIASVISLASIVATIGLFTPVSDAWVQVLVVVGFLAFPLGWIVLGLQAVRMDRPAMGVGPA